MPALIRAQSLAKGPLRTGWYKVYLGFRVAAQAGMKIVNGFDQGGEECTRCGLLYCWVQRDALPVWQRMLLLEAGSVGT